MTTNLNILVTRLNSAPGRIGQDGRISIDPVQAHSVHVRDGWSPLTVSDDETRPTGFGVVPLGTVWDEAALNNANQRGAFRIVPDMDGIRTAVATLRAAWGDLPVQDNSGLVPDLDARKGN